MTNIISYKAFEVVDIRVGTIISAEENNKLREENIKLRIALCNLRDEFLDLGGNPKQLELFDKNDISQLKIFED